MNSNKFKWIYIILSITVLVGAYMKIMHIEYGQILVMLSMISGIFVLASENTTLKKEIKKLKDE